MRAASWTLFFVPAPGRREQCTAAGVLMPALFEVIAVHNRILLFQIGVRSFRWMVYGAKEVRDLVA